MPAASSSLIGALRDAHWLNGARATAYTRIFAGLTLALAVAWVAMSHGGLDGLGKPIGTDFLSFWTASKLALSGHPALVYDVPTHAAAQRAAFAGSKMGYEAFFYPPIYLLICLPLALLPYLASLALWLGATGYAYWRVARAALGQVSGLALPVLAFPAVLSNIGHGQNGFLTAALFGGGALTLRTRPLVAGLCFGALIFKPHLGLLIPVALIAAGRWKSILAAAAAILFLSLASVLAFGIDTWRGFLAVSPLAKRALEQELVGSEKMQSVFAAVRLLHGSLSLAYGLHAVVALGAAGVVVHVARRAKDPQALGPVLVAAALLASPFLLDYDLILMAIPLAWVLGRAEREGFAPWEKSVLAAGFILPLLSRTLATQLHLPLGPVVVMAVLWITARRGLLSAERRAPAAAGLAWA